MLNVPVSSILSHIETIGYPLMFLAMVMEGPIATLAAAFASSLGFFNIYAVLALSIAGDIVGDIVLYTIGYIGGAKTLAKAEKMLKIKPALVEKIERLFNKHGKKTIFAVKSTTGLCWITFIAAGTVRMRFKEFILGSFLGGIIWSSFLVMTGYFFGYAFEKINDYIRYAGIIIFLTTAGFYTAITLYKRHRSKDIFKRNML